MSYCWLEQLWSFFYWDLTVKLISFVLIIHLGFYLITRSNELQPCHVLICQLDLLPHIYLEKPTVEKLSSPKKFKYETIFYKISQQHSYEKWSTSIDSYSNVSTSQKRTWVRLSLLNHLISLRNLTNLTNVQGFYKGKISHNMDT